MLEYIHPDFEMETLPGIAAEPQVYRGHAGVRRWFDSFYEVMDEVTLEPGRITELEPNRALVEFRMSARGHASGLEVQQQGKAIAILADDLLLRLEFLQPGDESPT